jgi:hypothetical protein
MAFLRVLILEFVDKFRIVQGSLHTRACNVWLPVVGIKLFRLIMGDSSLFIDNIIHKQLKFTFSLH